MKNSHNKQNQKNKNCKNCGKNCSNPNEGHGYQKDNGENE